MLAPQLLMSCASCVWQANNHFGKDTTVGEGSTIGAGASFGDGAVIGKGSVFGPGLSVGAGSYIAGNQVLAGGDHFGAGTSFGPNIRFGPNTEFDGDELFAAGSSFGDGTKFDWGRAGKDTFEGGHNFGVDTVWGENEPQATSGGPIRPASTGKAGVDQGVVVGLPPGYKATSIPGVYQYSAAAATSQDARTPHALDPAWHQHLHVRSGGKTGHEWGAAEAAEEKAAHKLAGVSNPKSIPHAAAPAAGLAAMPALPMALRQRRLARLSAQSQRWEASRDVRNKVADLAAAAAKAGAAAGVQAARADVSRGSNAAVTARSARHQEGVFGSRMSRWLAAHQSAAAGPSASLAAAAASSHRLHAKSSKGAKGKATGPRLTSTGSGSTLSGSAESKKLDSLTDKEVPVARVKTPSSISFFSMFE